MLISRTGTLKIGLHQSLLLRNGLRSISSTIPLSAATKVITMPRMTKWGGAYFDVIDELMGNKSLSLGVY